MFEQARLKLSWADHMIGQAEQGAHRFASTQPMEIRSEHNPETGELRVQVRGTPAQVRPDVIMLTGAAIQTLRSSLDFVTSEIWNRAKKLDNRLHFPIDTDDTQLERGNSSFQKINALNPDLAALIRDEIKPTKAGNFALWSLNRLANTDKHRNLLLVANWNGFEVDEIKRADGVRMRKTRFSAPAGSQNENYISVPNVEEYSEPQAIVEICIREPDIIRPDIFDRYEVIAKLRNFHAEVARTINAIEELLTPQSGECN